jgi:hypothetical protein
MNQGTLNIIYILIIVLCIYILKKIQDTKEGFYTHGRGIRNTGINKNKNWFGKSWFGGDRRFGAYTWRYPYSFYNTYPRWFYNNYIEPAYSSDPLYIVTNNNANCKKGCFSKYDTEKDLTSEELNSIRKCLKSCK